MYIQPLYRSKCVAEVYTQNERRGKYCAKCEKLITMSLSLVSAFFSFIRRQKSLYAWPVTRHHLYSIRNHMPYSRHLVHLLDYSMFALCTVLLLLFSFASLSFFFIVSPSGCSHQEYNDVIYDYVCNDCECMCPTETRHDMTTQARTQTHKRTNLRNF